MASTTENSQEFENEARAKKAAALALVFHNAGTSPETLTSLSDEGWGLAAAVAGVRTPSALTKAVVLQIVTAFHDVDVEDDDRQTIEYDALTTYDEDLFEVTNITATLSDGRTAYRVKVYEHADSDCYEEGCSDSHYVEDETSSYWATVVAGEVFSNEELDGVRQEYDKAYADDLRQAVKR